MADDYAPWDEPALRAVLAYHRRTAATWKEGTRMRAEHERFAKTLENAIATHAAASNKNLEKIAELRGECGRLRAELGRQDAA